MSVLSSAAAPLIVALAPAAFKLWQGRSLARRVGDASLPERLLAAQRVRGALTGVAFMLLVTIWPGRAAWTLPLLAMSQLAAGYPLRRRVYEETWSLPAYVWFFVRLWIAAFGFWILLGATPAIAAQAGGVDWIAAAVLALVLLLWHRRYAAAFRWILGARPMSESTLLARFAAMAESCGVGPVRFDVVDLRGGRFANAVALPSLHEPGAAFSQPLLDALDPDETAAICAHELAHLEHFNARRMRRLRLVNHALIAAAAATAPAFRIIEPEALGVMLVSWPVLMVSALAMRARARQQHETASDLRAIALCGDADALIRALTKTYALTRFPRRFAADLERNATHPSLAHRLQAIRDAANVPAATLGGPVTLVSSGGDATVTFHDDRLEWQAGATALHRFAYSGLSELRIDVRGARPRLVALDAARHRWELPLAEGDVARAQAALDAVDARLGRAAPAPIMSSWSARSMAVMVALFAAGLAQSALVVVATLAALKPAPRLVAAAGVATVAGAFLILRDASRMSVEIAAMNLLCAGFLLALAWFRRKDQDEPATLLVAVLAGCAALTLAAVVSNGFDLVRLHQGARDWQSATVFAAALAAALAWTRRRAALVASAGVAAVSVATACLGSTRALEAFATDPFLGPAPLIAIRTLDAASIAEFATTLDVYGLHVSPAGGSIVIATENENEETTFHVGRTGGALAPFNADEAAFVDEDRLVLMGHEDGAAVLRLVGVDRSSTVTWEYRLAGVTPSRLFVDRRTSAWTVLGWDTGRRLVRAAGRLGAGSADVRRWAAMRSRMVPKPVASTAGYAVVLDEQYEHPFLDVPLLNRWWWILQPNIRSTGRFRALGDAPDVVFPETRLDVDCPRLPIADRPVCTANDGARVRFFTMDEGLRRFDAVGSLPGRFYARGGSTGDAIVGWLDSAAVVVRPRMRDAIRVRRCDSECVTHLAADEHVVAAASGGGGRSTIHVYPIR